MDNCVSCGKLMSEENAQYCSDCAQKTFPVKCEDTCKKCKWHLYNGCIHKDCSEYTHTTGLKCLCSLAGFGEACKYYEEVEQ